MSKRRNVERMVLGLASLVAVLFLVSSAIAQEKGGSEEADEQAKQRELSPEERSAAKLLKKAESSYHGGQWYHAREMYRKAYEASPTDSPVRVHAALGRATLLWEQGNYASARTHIGEAMELAKKLRLNSAIGQLLLTLGHTEASQGNLESAEQTLGHCVKLAAEQNDPVFGPLCKLNRRLVRKLQGKSVGSEAEYKRALKKLEKVDSPLTAGLSLAKTAELYAQGGRRGRAFDLLSKADAQYEKAGSMPAKARNRMLKARFLQEAGKWDQARRHLEGLAKTFESMGSKPALVDVLGLLGKDAQHRNAYGRAGEYYERGLKVAKQTGSPQLQAKVQVALCEVGAGTGDASAEVYCEEAVETFARLGMPLMTAKAHAARARLAQQTNNLEKARDEFLSALEIHENKVHAQIRDPSLERNALTNLCQIEMRMQVDGAFYRCREALETLDDSSSARMRAATHYALGNSATREGHPETGVEHLKKAATMYAEMEPADLAMYGDTKLRLGAVYQKTDQPKKAEQAFESGVDKLAESSDKRLLSTRVQLRTQYAQIELGNENWKRAIDQLEKVADEAKKVGDTATHGWAYSAMARAQNSLGKHEAAKKSLQKALPLAKQAGDEELVETIEGNLKAFSE